MTIDASSTLREIAFEVCTALDRVGVQAVLSGGGAATIYAPEFIQSHDLDFILAPYPRSAAPEHALEQLGFHREGQEYRHQVSPFLLEFPPGPLAIGDELITRWATLREGSRLLHVLLPNDSCRDRLAAFYHFRDRSSLAQAAAICAAVPGQIEFDILRAWSVREGRHDEYAEFLQLVEA